MCSSPQARKPSVRIGGSLMPCVGSSTRQPCAMQCFISISKRFAKIAGGCWRGSLRRNHAIDMCALQQRNPLVAMLSAEPLEDVAIDPLRLGGERGERGRIEEADDR